MTAPTTSAQNLGQAVELGRYKLPASERVLYGQRIDGVVRVTDPPARGDGRSFLVERGIEQDGNEALQALIADYLRQASGHEDVP